MTQTPYSFFLGNSLTTPNRDSHGEYYTDMLRRPVLEAAFADDGDLAAGEQLFNLYFKWKDYEPAEQLAARLFRSTDEIGWLVKQLRCLLLMRAFSKAAALHDERQTQTEKPIVGDWDAIQLMRDTIFSDGFLRMDETEFEKLFFLKPLMRKLGPHLRFLSYSLMDRFFIDLLVLARAHVENCGASFHYVSCSDLFSVQNKSDCELALAEGITLATKERRKLKWLQSNPPHMKEVYEKLPHYGDDYITQLNPGLKNMVQAAKLMICDWESQYFNIRDGQRVTTQQPESYDHVVHCIGESETFGYGTEDAHTFCSFLQARLNEDRSGKVYRVENYGFPGGALPFSVRNLLQSKISAGDKVVFFGFPELGQQRAGELGISQDM